MRSALPLLVGAGVLVVGVALPTAAHATFSGLVSTGLDATGQPLVASQSIADPHWIRHAADDSMWPTTDAIAVANDYPIGAPPDWLYNSADSQWISVEPDAYAEGLTYTFDLTFSLDSDPTAATFSYLVGGDDSYVVTLNGTQIGSGFNDASLALETVAGAPLVLGVNVLSVAVHNNQYGPMGLRVEFQKPGCTLASDCTFANLPVCEAGGTCGPCASDDDCTDVAAPLCEPDGSCGVDTGAGGAAGAGGADVGGAGGADVGGAGGADVGGAGGADVGGAGAGGADVGGAGAGGADVGGAGAGGADVGGAGAGGADVGGAGAGGADVGGAGAGGTIAAGAGGTSAGAAGAGGQALAGMGGAPSAGGPSGGAAGAIAIAGHAGAATAGHAGAAIATAGAAGGGGVDSLGSGRQEAVGSEELLGGCSAGSRDPQGLAGLLVVAAAVLARRRRSIG